MTMRTKLVPALLVLVGLAFTATAQSSGNFAAKIGTTQCAVNDTNGALTGGLTGTLLETTIKTPNSSFTALDIRPSMVTGLFTKTKVTSDSSTATAVAGVKVRVLLDGKIVAPGTPAGSRPTDGLPGNLADDGNDNNDGWVTYNKRFQQLSTNIFNALMLQPTSANANEAACVGPGVLTVTQVKTFSQSGGIEINP